ncbi:translocation/assembly module TamB domain-containing protein [Bdellovibrionota bacterium FG-1]
MRKSPFVIFAIVMAVLIGGVISFIQGPGFARVMKEVLYRYAPKDMGIVGDFEGLDVTIFPPGLSVRKPKIRVIEHNIANLPPGSEINAERIDLEFRPVQMFSGNIRVHEVTIVNGDVHLFLGDLYSQKPQKKGYKIDFHWDELFQIHAEALSIRNTQFHLEAAQPEVLVDFKVDSARVGQWSGSGGLGYELDVALSDVKGHPLTGVPMPSQIDRLAGVAHINAAGLQLDGLALVAPGLKLDAKGVLKGNVLGQKNLGFEADVNVEGDAAQAMTWAFQNPKNRPDVSGLFTFDGKLRVDPLHIEDTLRIEGSMKGTAVRFQKWSADRMSSKFAWQSAAKTGGEITVGAVEISSREIPRIGGNQAGSGGKISLGAFKVNLANPALTVPVTLERVHLHWLATPVLKDVYPLDLRASGPVTIEFRPATDGDPWELEAKVALRVEDFQLDNQHLGKVKPLHKILHVPKISVEGNVIVDSNAIRTPSLTVSTGTSSFKGVGEVVFKAGYDLVFSGQANLQDVGQLAENDIRGTGSLVAHVHGPSSALLVDFDTDLKDAEYLKLRLGDLKGRLTWDDGHDHVILSKLIGHRGLTTYLGDGNIDLSEGKDTIEMEVKIPPGQIQDVIPVFDQLTSDLWWFPHALTGATHGEVKISGGVSMDRLVVQANLLGEEWAYLGERFATVAIDGGYDRGKYQINDFKALKRFGRLFGKISLDSAGILDWGLRSEGLTIADFDHVARLDVPMRARVLVSTLGCGPDGGVKSITQIKLEDFAVRGTQLPGSSLVIRSEGGRAQLSGVALGGQGTLDASYYFKLGGESSLKAEFKQLDFSPILLLLNPKLIQDRALTGRFSGLVALNFKSGKIERANGKLELSDYQLAKTGSRFELTHPISVKIDDGSFDLKELAIRSSKSEASLSLESVQGKIDGTISGDLDTSLAEFVTPVIGRATGVAALDFSLGGTLREPTVLGKMAFEGVTVKIPALDSAFENTSGVVQVRQNHFSIQNIRADLAGGTTTAEGTLTVFADHYPEIAIKGTLGGSKLKIPPFQYVKVKGDLELQGKDLPYLVDGSILVESALTKQKILTQHKEEGTKAMKYLPPPSSHSSSDYPLFKLNIGVVANGNVLIQNDLFDAEARGRLTVVNTLEAPRILGSGEIVSGKLLFKDRAFQIQSASATFDNPTVINPSFTLNANTDINGTKIQLYVAGRMDKMDKLKIELTSNPVMPENEILSLLTIGSTTGDAKRLSSTDRSVYEQGEAASLLLHSLDFNREVQDKTGIQIQLDEAVAPVQQGVSAFKPQNTAESIAQPRIVIKKQIGKKLDLSVGTTVGGATAFAGREVDAEYHFTPGFSVQGVWNNYEGTDTQARHSLGLDLKLQKRFR